MYHPPPALSGLGSKESFPADLGIWVSMLLNLSPHYPDRSANLLTSDETHGECGVSLTVRSLLEGCRAKPTISRPIRRTRRDHRPNPLNALCRLELCVHGLGCRVPNGENPTTPDFAWLCRTANAANRSPTSIEKATCSGRRAAANLVTKDGARRIAANIAKLPPKVPRSEGSWPWGCRSCTSETAQNRQER